jgi:hypothetical protein
MKHYNFKTEIAGAAKKGKKPKPATLKPPKLGDYKSASSYQYAEILDLISDGPIEGLVNKDGYTLPYNALLQGVYLNNVPVEETNQFFLTDVGRKIQLGDQTNFNTGMKDLFADIQSSTRNEDIPFPYPPTEELYQFKQLYYSFNDVTGNGGFPGSTAKGSVSGLNEFENYTTQISNEKYPVFTYGPTFVSGGSDNTPIRRFYASSGKYETQFSLGIKHKDDVFDPSTNAGQGLEEFLYASKSGNLYQKEYTLGILKKNGLTEDEASNADKEDVKKIFTQALSPDVDNWYLDNQNYIKPYVCITVDDVVDGYDFYTHVNSFLMKDSQEAVTSVLNYDAYFGLDSSYSSEGLNISKNTFSMFVPNLAEDGTWDGRVKGFFFFCFDIEQLPYYKYIPEQDASLLNPGEDNKSPYDVLVLAQAQQELNYLKNLEGFAIVDESETGFNQEDKKMSAYYETYIFERRIVDKGNCDLDTILNRQLVEKGFTSDYEKEVVLKDQSLFDSDIVRRGVQIKYAFRFRSSDPELVDVWTDADYPALYNTNYKSAKMYLNGDLVDESYSKGSAVLSFIVPPSDELQTITVDVVAYADLNMPNSCPYTLQTMDDVRAKVVQPRSLFEDLSSRVSYVENTTRKFNWSNVFSEFRNGSAKQLPLNYFKDVHTDYAYNYSLFGPFSVSRKVIQRIEQGDGSLKKDGKYPRLNFASKTVPEMDEDYLTAVEEGSNDFRSSTEKDYSTWDVLDQDYEEKAKALTHIIENPNVKSVWFTLSIDALKDTVEKTVGDIEDPDLDAGAPLPSVVNFRVETGSIDATGNTVVTYSKLFQITAMVESTALLDVGNEDNAENPEYFDYVNEFDDIGEEDENGDVINKGGMFTEFELEDVQTANGNELDTRSKEHTSRRRFIRITKLSTESSTTLAFKEIGVLKVTERVRGQLNYPYSAYNGIKIDARVFSELPTRSFDTKLKKVKIPSNYFPTYRNGKDKRYYDDSLLLSLSDEEGRSIYKGDWDGTFKFEWTDNPAWILYDMITNERYGLGAFIEESSVNKWDLYKIAKFCDAVDSDGYFIGVSDGRGGLEPRFSCNIIFSDETKAFDAINTIATIFRGVVYYNNSTIEFSDDRPKEPVALFVNSNVKEGVFTYSNYQRDEQINTVEVIYIDRYDGWRTKIELVENQADISKRGIFKKSINAYGITSKAMARRAGEHLLYQTTEENQNVAFSCGMESLLCKPGDLISIDDDLKSFKSNFGRILEVNDDEKSIRISNKFSEADFASEVTLYKPSAITDIEVIEEEVSLVRERLDKFNILGNNQTLANTTGWNYMLGDWEFNSYQSGFNDVYTSSGTYISPLQEEYALYTNKSSSFVDPSGVSTLWFNTDVTGWVFSTGEYRENEANNLFILEPSVFDFNELQFFDPSNLNKTSLKHYESGSLDKRGDLIDYFTGGFRYNNPLTDLLYYKGTPSEDSLIGSNIQIFTVPTTGFENFDYGAKLYIDQDDANSSLLKFVPPGTAYRIKIQNQETSIYKITSIKEEDKNEFSIIAGKFDSGKYQKIDGGYF